MHAAQHQPEAARRHRGMLQVRPSSGVLAARKHPDPIPVHTSLDEPPSVRFGEGSDQAQATQAGMKKPPGPGKPGQAPRRQTPVDQDHRNPSGQTGAHQPGPDLQTLQHQGAGRNPAQSQRHSWTQVGWRAEGGDVREPPPGRRHA